MRIFKLPPREAISYTMHVDNYSAIILDNDQLDTHLLYFTIRLLQSSKCFEQRRVHHQEVKLY